jgi:hypothetical protein
LGTKKGEQKFKTQQMTPYHFGEKKKLVEQKVTALPRQKPNFTLYALTLTRRYHDVLRYVQRNTLFLAIFYVAAEASTRIPWDTVHYYRE